ncbi:MAG TPA: NAD(P)/FAD-dependent oxidoreductase [Ktedonobacterales bacterium]|nr:NAD(P)/FAD-dependent oxidoreductase [Ktedonobacterales bacterium]
MPTTVDLLVLGTGSAAQSVAYPCREAGWSVAVVDCRPYGGTCQLRGCDPKKVLVGVTDALASSRRLEGKGVSAANLRMTWPDLQRFKRTFTDPAPAQNEAGFAEAGIQMYHGIAQFTSPTSLRVGETNLSARHIVIATGAEPAPLGIPGEDLLTTSEQFLSLEDLPQRIVFVGGGYISFEFASMAARAGVQVHLVHRGERPLTSFDPDLVDQLVASVRELGIDVRLRTAVTSIEERDGQLLVRTHAGSAGSGGAQDAGETGDIVADIVADMVVHGAGRAPEIGELALEQGGVAFDRKRGIHVNEYLQSVSQPAIYAAGDAAASGGWRLTPVAGLEGGIVAQNLLHGATHIPNYTGTATVVYTLPPLARVGLLESEARAQGLRFQAHQGDMSGWYSSRRIGLTQTGFKVLVEEGTGRILGAHLLEQHADEVINLFGLAMRNGLPASALKALPYAYPTSSSDVSYMV